jgi:ABC-type multidrug transport system ATPase subunit
VAARALEAAAVHNVGRMFGSTVALRNVSERFEAGSIALVEGANGSGKSTLLAILSSSLRPTTGRAEWAPLGGEAERVRAHVGWLGHDALVYPDLSGFENLHWAAQLYGLEPDVVTATADRLGIGAFARRPVRTMSRGQRQRIALARAILHRPSLLLLDEPTTGLDRDGVALLLRVVREEADGGAIVVVIAHEAGLAEKLGARSVRIDRGQVVERRAAEAAPPPG